MTSNSIQQHPMTPDGIQHHLTSSSNTIQRHPGTSDGMQQHPTLPPTCMPHDRNLCRYMAHCGPVTCRFVCAVLVAHRRHPPPISFQHAVAPQSAPHVPSMRWAACHPPSHTLHRWGHFRPLQPPAPFMPLQPYHPYPCHLTGTWPTPKSAEMLRS